MWSRRASRATVWSHTSGAGDVPRERSFCTHIQPAINRTVKQRDAQQPREHGDPHPRRGQDGGVSRGLIATAIECAGGLNYRQGGWRHISGMGLAATDCCAATTAAPASAVIVAPRLHRGHNRHRQHQRQSDCRDDVADVRGAPAQSEERHRGKRSDERALPDKLQQRPADGLGRRFLKQPDLINRAHHEPPDRCPCLRHRCSAFDHAANLGELVRRCTLAGEGLKHELRGRAAERAIHQVADELTLGLLLAETRMIDVRTVALVAADEPLLRHDLHQLECCGVGSGPVPHQHFMHLPHGAGAELPEHAQDRKLGVSWSRCLQHWRCDQVYEHLRKCQRRSS